MNIISFNEALGQSRDKRYLLLGNGFSIALFPEVFSYNSLLNEAKFDGTCVQKVFNDLKTSDFERVIKALKDSANILAVYSKESKELVDTLKKEAEILKNILVETITKNHPDKIISIPEERLKSGKKFLEHFNESKIYTLNYDLLLYWTLLSGDLAPDQIDDGFRNTDHQFGADYRTFDSPHSPTFWYLHGGLHLFDAGSEIRKYIWSDTGRPIMEQVREALEKELYPIFVSEGSSDEKLTKINHSAYLSKALRSFEAICDPQNADLFIFGHSLAENDEHILNKIVKGKIKRCFVSVFDPTSGEVKEIVKRAEQLKSKRAERYPLDIVFYDAKSARVWDLPSGE